MTSLETLRKLKNLEKLIREINIFNVWYRKPELISMVNGLVAGMALSNIKFLHKPAIYGEISVEELVKIMPSKFTGSDGKEYFTRRYPFDKKWFLTSDGEIKRFLRETKVNEMKYEEERWDCDNFALYLMTSVLKWMPGLAFGFIIIPGHAKNVYINDKREVKEVEPQSDVVQPLHSEIHQYMFA